MLALKEPPGVLDGGLEAVLGFLDGFVGKTDDVYPRANRPSRFQRLWFITP